MILQTLAGILKPSGTPDTWSANNAVLSLLNDYLKVSIVGNGANGGTEFVNNAGTAHTFSTSTGVTTSTAQSKYGGSSILVPATDKYIISSSAHADFAVGTGDFIISRWIRYNAFYTYNGDFLIGGNAYTTALYYQYRSDNSVRHQFYIVGAMATSGSAANASPVLSLDTWYLLTVIRISGVDYIYVDGSLVETLTNTGNVTANTQFQVGYGNLSGSGVNAYLQGIFYWKAPLLYDETLRPTYPTKEQVVAALYNSGTGAFRI